VADENEKSHEASITINVLLKLQKRMFLPGKVRLELLLEGDPGLTFTSSIACRLNRFKL
jgi:hypothetical protein